MDHVSSAFCKIAQNKYHLKDALIGAAVIGGVILSHNIMVKQSKRSRALKAAQCKVSKLRNNHHSCFDNYKESIRPDVELKILQMSATEIRQNIIDGNIKCTEALLVIAYKTHECNQTLNAILEEWYDYAYKLAADLDTQIAEKRKNTQEWNAFIGNKQLLGIPISIKDLFVVRDSDCTLGLRKFCNRPFDEDGAVIKLIREQGGIPYVKTNCPQLNMLPESVNHIIGETKNPYNEDYVAGGSTGGEAALIACNASKLGIGTDIGGSLRMPAHFCGCIAYKPSSKRSPQTGKASSDRSQYVNKFAIRAATGPLAKSMDDIIRYCKVMWSPSGQNIDPYMLPLSFRNDIFCSKKKLKIGFWKEGDGWFTSTECVKRAICEVVDVLSEEYEYELIELPFNKGFEVLKLYFSFTGAESYMAEYLCAIDDTEDLFDGFAKLRQLQLIPSWCKYFVIRPLLPLLGEHRKQRLLDNLKSGDLSMREYKNLCKEIIKFKYEFWEWLDSFGEIDCVLCPTNWYPAFKHNSSDNFTANLTATFLQNILDCSAGTYGPVTFVNKNECHYDLNKLPKNERDSYSKKLDAFMKDAYGLPIGVQIFGKPYADEVVLRVMSDLDKYYKKNRPQPLVKFTFE